MDNERATRTCSQCQREVALANFALHETHCSRFLSICPDCGDSVPTEQMDQHKQEQHTEVRCSKCHKKMERCQLPDHESDECVERLQSCEFCELELVWRELDEHSLACGSRTELCGDCGRYVTLRDQARHDFTCSPTADASGPAPAKAPANSRVKVTVADVRRLAASFPFDEMRKQECKDEEDEEDEEEEYELFGQGVTSQLSSTYQAISLSNGPTGGAEGDPNQISTCPLCHLALPLVTLRWHQVKCQIYLNMNGESKLV